MYIYISIICIKFMIMLVYAQGGSIMLIIGCIFISVLGLIGVMAKNEKEKIDNNYKNDEEGRKKIIKYFRDKKAINKEHGIL